MAVAFFSMTADFMSFHRRPFIQRLAAALAEQGHSVLCFNRPRWCLTALLGKSKALPDPSCVAGVRVYQLLTLWPAGWCFGSPLLTYWLVALPIRWQVRRLLNRLGEPRNLAWFYKPDQYLYLRHLGLEYAYTHFDNYDDDGAYPFSRHPRYRATLEQCLRNSRMAFATSRALQAKLAATHPVTYLPNAVDDLLVPSALPVYRHPGRPVIGFVGVIDDTTDAQLIGALCSAFPGCDLVMVGAVRNSHIAALATVHSNLKLAGRREYSQLPAVLASFDVGICPYAASPFNNFRNPLKIYEYFSFGLPVVTTRCDFEPEALPLVFQADNADEFVAAVQQALAETGDAKRIERHTFALANRWSCRAAQALSALAIDNRDAGR